MSSGVLVLVGTPIGNLGDLSPRATDALAAADAVACEDTRTPMWASSRPVRRVVVVSDAGMPGISDPGERLVAAAAAAGHRIEVVPGPSAAVTALVGSGLPAGRFVFEGFLPRKGSGRSERLTALAIERRTVVLYEAPHRLQRTLVDLVALCGADRRVAFGRELTKLHEEFWRGTLGDALDRCAEVEPRGEYVIVLEGAPPPGEIDDHQLIEALAAARGRGESTRDAVAAVAERFGAAKRRVYDLATAPTPTD